MNGLSYLIYQLLLLNKINIDKKELTFQVESHPSYPSLHSISGVLDHFNIDNLAVDIPKNKETLAQLPTSFLAQINTNNGQEFVVVSSEESHYKMLFGNNQKQIVSIDTFLLYFTGIIVAVEKDNLVEKTKVSSAFLGNSLIISSFAFTLYLFILSRPSIISILFFTVSILGIFISLVLKKQGQGIQTIVGNSLCSGDSEFKDCDAVLSSKGAQVFGYFKLYDISFIYFTGLALSVFLLSLLNQNESFTYLVSFIAFPITLYSIYYQFIVLKKWCLLCLSIVAILWIQTILAFTAFNSNITISFSFYTFSVLAFSYIIVLALWNSISPQLDTLKNLNDIKVKHFKFKRNFSLFYNLLNQSNVVSTHIPDTAEIVFGNNQSPLQITIITNPFCGHCREVHTLIENILKKYSEHVQITIRFGLNPNDLESDVVKIASRLLELYHQDSQDKCLEAMNHIYNGMSPKQWFNTFGTTEQEKDNYLKILSKGINWCREHNINFTPEILINGKSFPNEYDRSDLLFFIEDLYENYHGIHQEVMTNETQH